MEIRTLSQLAQTVRDARQHGEQVFVRYSRGPAADGGERSRDWANGTQHHGLSCTHLWDPDQLRPDTGRRSLAGRVASAAYLQHQGLAGTRAWVLVGQEVGRDSDNAPLVVGCHFIAALSEALVEQAVAIERERTDAWRRYSDPRADYTTQGRLLYEYRALVDDDPDLLGA